MQTKSENEMNLIQSTSQTMSSREIAELTGKEHKHVRRDIMSMLDDLKISDEGWSIFGLTLKTSKNTKNIGLIDD